MAIKLTEQQLKVVKGMVEITEAYANQMLHIMENHGLDKVEGCRLMVTIDPCLHYTTRDIYLGRDIRDDFGAICLTRGKSDAEYEPLGKNSCEYEKLFASKALRGRLEKSVQREKPLPPDGLWIGDSRNDAPVGNWEWDVNDSLS